MLNKNELLERVERIIEAGRTSAKTSQGRSQIECISVCAEGYAEPSYSDSVSGVVVFGNWNSVSKWNERRHEFETLDRAPAIVGERLEKLGVSLEWSDEWTTCCQCGKAVRIKPDSYSWQPYYVDDGCGTLVCGDCVHEDPGPYLQALEGRDDACVTVDIDLEAAGYQRVEEDFEYGLYGGQSADPHKIAAALTEQGVSRFLFKLDYNRQFDSGFSLWVHESEYAKLDIELFAVAEKDGPDPAVNMRAALEDASRQMNEIEGQIKVASCDLSTGKARVRTVTPQEFVEGRALD
jgi:hypothetical protein